MARRASRNNVFQRGHDESLRFVVQLKEIPRQALLAGGSALHRKPA